MVVSVFLQTGRNVPAKWRPKGGGVVSDEVESLDVPGSALYEALHRETDSYAVTVMIVEAARTKDRLDKLDLILRADVETWAVLVHDLRTEDYELRINSAAAEARQQASVLRQLLAEIRRQQNESEPRSPSDEDGLDDL